MNLKIFQAIITMGLFLPSQMTSLDAATTKKKHVKKHKIKVKKRSYRHSARPLPEIKDKSFMCNQQTCIIPPPMVETPAPSPSPQVEQPKVHPEPIAIQPMKEDHHKKNEDCEDEHLGIYFGCSVGPTQLGGTYQLTVGNSSLDQSGISNLSYDGDVFFGYIRRAGDYGVGIQAYYDPFAFKVNDSYSLNAGKQAYSIKFNDAFGGFINLGYFANRHTFFYGRGGMEFQKISMTLTDTATPSGAFDSGSGSYKQIITLGAGARYTMGNILFGCEYIYKSYPNLTVSGSTKVTPQAASLRVSAAYLF